MLLLLAVFLLTLVVVQHKLPGTTDSSEGGNRLAAAAAARKTLLLHGGRQLKESVDTDLRNREAFPSQLVTPPTEPPEQGYVIVERLDKTPLDAMPELLNVQCWAEAMKMQVVQPFLKNNTLVSPLEAIPLPNHLKYESLYDFDLWPLDREYGKPIALDDIDLKDITDAIIVDVAPEYSQASTSSQNCIPSEYRHLGLRVAQELCFSSRQSTAQILEEVGNFVGFLHRQYQAGKVVVIIRRWPGDKEQDMQQCSNDPDVRSIIGTISPSGSILRDTDAFVEAHFPGKFLAVVLTSEVRRLHSLSSCLERMLTSLHGLKVAKNVTSTFLMLQGKRAQSIGNTLQFKTFFKALYHKTYQLEKWRTEVSRASALREETYEALLAQVIASRAECLVTASTHHLPDYLRHHRRQPCVINVPECQEFPTPRANWD